MTNQANIFEMATRERFRFPYKGMATVEDLWAVSITGLDSIYKTLSKELKQSREESLLNTKTAQDKEVEIKIEIVKHIVEVKMAEKNARLQAKEKKEQREKIMEILADKENESLKNKTPEQLKAMLAEME